MENMVKYNLGSIEGHLFINSDTELTSYCLEHCGEVGDIQDCDGNCKEFNDKYKKGNGRFIEAFHVKTLIDTVGELIIPMELTDEVVNTQFHDKVEECKTLQYNVKDAD